MADQRMQARASRADLPGPAVFLAPAELLSRKALDELLKNAVLLHGWKSWSLFSGTDRA